MDHEKAAALLSDYVEGNLPAGQVSGMEEHLRVCSECREALKIFNMVRGEIAEHGRPLFGDHPASDELASYAAGAEGLSPAETADIESHLRVCPTCRRELDITREARRAAGVWWKRTWSGLLAPSPVRPGLILRPALALLMLLMIYPTYLGLVELPRVKEDLTGVRRVSAPAGGRGAALLFLEAPSRGAETRIPEVRPAPGAPSQPIFIDCDVTDGGRRPPACLMEISLWTVPRGDLTWSAEVKLGEIWDEENQVVGFTIPRGKLAPGEYAIELGEAGVPELIYTGSFRIIE